MALTVILLCLPDTLNCLSSRVTETEILPIKHKRNSSPVKSVWLFLDMRDKPTRGTTVLFNIQKNRLAYCL